MIVPDVNLLLYAYDTSSPYHEMSRNWWAGCLNGRIDVGLLHPVLSGFIRIASSPRVFLRPMELSELSGIVQSWLDSPVARILDPMAGHYERVLNLMKAAGAAGGNLTTDADIAASAIEYNATVHTSDRDFRRFSGLKVFYPLEGYTRKSPN